MATLLYKSQSAAQSELWAEPGSGELINSLHTVSSFTNAEQILSADGVEGLVVCSLNDTGPDNSLKRNSFYFNASWVATKPDSVLWVRI